MTQDDMYQLTQELPADLVSRLSQGMYAKIAAELSGVPDILNERHLYAKVGADLMSRLQERRQIAKGLLHLHDLGA